MVKALVFNFFFHGVRVRAERRLRPHLADSGQSLPEWEVNLKLNLVASAKSVVVVILVIVVSSSSSSSRAVVVIAVVVATVVAVAV